MKKAKTYLGVPAKAWLGALLSSIGLAVFLDAAYDEGKRDALKKKS